MENEVHFAHFRSVIAAIDQFLQWLPTMDKEQFIERLRKEKGWFEKRLALHDPGYGLMPARPPGEQSTL